MSDALPNIWTHSDLQRYLDANAIPAEIILVDTETPTVPAAAEALKVAVEQIAKTVLFFVDETPYAVIANGTRRVDTRKLASRFGINRKKIKLADGEAVARLTGYAPGTVPPLGHRSNIPVLMSPTLRDYPIVFAGGGGIHAMLKIDTDTLLRLTNAELLDVLEDVTLLN